MQNNWEFIFLHSHLKHTLKYIFPHKVKHAEAAWTDTSVLLKDACTGVYMF